MTHSHRSPQITGVQFIELSRRHSWPWVPTLAAQTSPSHIPLQASVSLILKWSLQRIRLPLQTNLKSYVLASSPTLWSCCPLSLRFIVLHRTHRHLTCCLFRFANVLSPSENVSFPSKENLLYSLLYHVNGVQALGVVNEYLLGEFRQRFLRTAKVML